MHRGDKRVCPFCGRTIHLSECTVVATHAPAASVPSSPLIDLTQQNAARPAPARLGGGLAGLTDEPAGGQAFPAVGLPRPERHGGAGRGDGVAAAPPAPQSHRPLRSQASVLWQPRPASTAPARRGSWLSGRGTPPDRPAAVVPLSSFPAERLPRRVCSSCGHSLPPDLDDREAHILAVVGINAAGKTHFLATALTEATRRRGLAVAGVREFAPDVETAERFHVDYYTPVYRENQQFTPTPVNVRVRDEPLTFRTTVEQRDPLLLMTYDIAGETLVHHRDRATVTPFLRRASAVIFLADPLEFDFVRARVPRSLLQVNRSIHQTDLLAATLQELEYAPGGLPVPVAVAVSKSDLLDDLLPDPAAVLGRSEPGSSPDAWVRRVKAASLGMRNALLHLGEGDLVETAEAHGQVTFHAVSALGFQPRQGEAVVPRPRGVLDPLGTLLQRLCGVLG